MSARNQNAIQVITRALVALETGIFRFPAPVTGKIIRVKVLSDESASGGNAVFDVNVNGTSIWNADQTQRVKITSGNSSGEVTGLTSDVTKDDDVTVDFDGFTGSAASIGDDLRIVIEIQETGATKTDSELLDRGNHTGTQLAATVSNFSSAVDAELTAQNVLINPMTAADDIVVGGASGVPTRVAKPAANKVWGTDSGGVLGYKSDPAAGGITALTGDVVASGSGSVAAAVKAASAEFALSGIISPSSLSSDQNDYNPTSLSTADVIRQTSSASVNITGLQGGTTGRIILFINIGSSNITLAHNSGSSSAGNKFLCQNSTDMTLLPNASCILWWDTTSNAWRVTASVKKLISSDLTWPPAPANPNSDDEEFNGDFSAWTDVGIDTTHAKKAISGSLAQIECVVANSDLRGIYKAISGSTFRVQAGPFRYTGPQAGSPEYDFGFYLRETSTTKGLLVGPRCNSNTGGFTGTQLETTRFTGQSWQNAATQMAPWNQWDWLWIEAELTSTNVILRISNDGVFFKQILSELKTASFTTAPNAIGIGYYAESQTFFFTVDYIRRLG